MQYKIQFNMQRNNGIFFLSFPCELKDSAVYLLSVGTNNPDQVPFNFKLVLNSLWILLCLPYLDENCAPPYWKFGSTPDGHASWWHNPFGMKLNMVSMAFCFISNQRWVRVVENISVVLTVHLTDSLPMMLC